MTHDQTCGVGSLISIYEHCINQFGSAVVRWCPKCGAVVVDEDYDGRIKPGGFRAFQCPESVKQLQVSEHSIILLKRKVTSLEADLENLRKQHQQTDTQ